MKTIRFLSCYGAVVDAVADDISGAAGMVASGPGAGSGVGASAGSDDSGGAGVVSEISAGATVFVSFELWI